MSSEVTAPSVQDDLQQQLIDALLDGELQKFCSLLSHPAVNPAHKYGKPHFGTCLEVACRQRDRHEFVKELLKKVKPNVNHVVPEPIHYAAGRGNVQALELLLKDKRTKINAQDSTGRTALHFAAKNFPEDKSEAQMFEKCMQLLLENPDTDVNRSNHKGFTPVHEAAHSAGGKAAVEALLRHAGTRARFIDLDSARGHGRTARDTILAKFPEMKDTLPPNTRTAAAAPQGSQRAVSDLERGTEET